MPTVDLPFGDQSLDIELPDRTFVVPSFGAAKLAPIDDLAGAVNEALNAPLGCEPIGGLVKPGSTVTIAFDDPTVPAYGPIRGVAIQAVLERLKHAGVRDRDIRFICANALHRKFPPEELAVFVGQDAIDLMGDRLSCHDAEDPYNLVHLGTTPNGHDVEVHRAVIESDLTVYVNAAAFRGFAGGWKSVCVGLSTFRSIRHHHTPDGMSMSVDDNPMHNMLNEMAKVLEDNLTGTIFKIDAVEANPFQTAHVFAGDTWAVRERVLSVLREAYPPRRAATDERFDVVLYGVPNWSPYAIFATMNPILTLLSSGLGYLGGTIQALGKPGCTVVMATPCPLQWDRAHHPSYPDVWDNVLSQTNDPYEIERTFTDRYATHEEFIEQYRNGYAFHPVHGVLGTHPLRRKKHCGRIIVAGIQDPAVAERLGFEAAASVDAALAMAADTHGPDFSIAYARHPAAPSKTGM